MTRSDWAGIRSGFIGELARRGLTLHLRDRVWAVTLAGEWVALPGTSDSPEADKWWLGCDPEKLHARHAVGVILLCQARSGPLHAIGLSRGFLDDLEPKLVRNHRQVFFNVARRGDRFLLQLRGGDEVDVTGHVDDFAWISDTGVSTASHGTHSFAAERPIPGTGTAVSMGTTPLRPEASEATIRRFFAIVRNNALHPLDDVGLKPGSLHLVEARETDVVPGNAALRRIMARGGPHDLPADLAERHDYYAHGGGRR